MADDSTRTSRWVMGGLAAALGAFLILEASAEALPSGASPAASATPAPSAASAACASLFATERPRLHSSQRVDLCPLTAGRPVLLVNTASHCGFTSQFGELEALHRQYAAQGLVVIGVPSDDFSQEADDQAETAEVCYRNYGVSFTMLAPTHVRGDGADPIFAEVARQSQAPSWNFTKYLIDARGEVVQQWGSRVSPLSDPVQQAVRSVLAGS